MDNQEKIKSIALVVEFIAKAIAVCIFFYLFISITQDVRDISNSVNEINKSLSVPKEFATMELAKQPR